MWSKLTVLLFALALASGASAQVTVGGSGGGGSGVAPAVLVNNVNDTFNRTAADLGANWTAYANNFSVTPGRVIGTANALLNVVAYTGVASNPTQTVTGTVLSPQVTGNAEGVAVRISGTIGTSVSLYDCIETTTALTIAKITGISNVSNGVTTVLATVAITGVAGDINTLQVVGNTLTCSHNLSNTILLQANDASSPLTTGLPGIISLSNLATMSYFSFQNSAAPAGAAENIVVDGNSIIAANGNGSNTTDPATSYLYIPTSPAYVTNLGVSAKCMGVGCTAATAGTVESMLSTETSAINPLFVPGIKNILVIAFPCTNDIANGSRTPAQCLTDLTTYVTVAHAQGWKVLVVPEISRRATILPTLDANVGIMNTLEIANSEAADGIVVLPQSVTGVGTSQNTVMFNADQVHPTEIFHAYILARALSASLSKL